MGNSLQQGREEWPVRLAVFLHYCGDHMVLMTALPYITYGACRDRFSNLTAHDCFSIEQDPDLLREVEDQAAVLYMAENMMSTVPSIFLTTVLGGWTDRHGRKAAMLLPYVGSLVSAALFLLAHYLPSPPVVPYLMLAFVVRALCGHFVILDLASSSHLTDLVRARQASTSKKEVKQTETTRLVGGHQAAGQEGGWKEAEQEEGEGEEESSQLLAALCRLQVYEAGGIVVGAVLGWALQTAVGAPLAFSGAGAILLVGVVVVVCWMKEYRPLPCISSPGGADAEGTTVLQKFREDCLQVFNLQKLQVPVVVLWSCVTTTFLMTVYVEGRATILVLFVQQPPLSWPGNMLCTLQAAMSTVHLAFLSLIAVRLSDVGVAVVVLLCSTAGSVWCAFPTSTVCMMLACSLCHLVYCIFPTLSTIVSKELPADQTGRALAKLSAAEAVANVLGPAVASQLYTHTSRVFQGTAFLALGAIPLTVLMVAVAVDALCQPHHSHHGQHRHKGSAVDGSSSTSLSGEVTASVRDTRDDISLVDDEHEAAGDF